MGLLIAGIAALVLIAVAAAYFVWSRGADSQVATASETPSVSPSVTPSATSTATTTANAENEQVKQARIAEEQERYAHAIKLYDEYLTANPQASDHSAIAKQVAELRTLNGHLQMAKFFMDKNDVADAHKDYSNALKLRPESKLAQAGLAEANARLSRAP
jgi:tetratricopeptide (TPR) repeat protein